jgi:hypothetical protein
MLASGARGKSLTDTPPEEAKVAEFILEYRKDGKSYVAIARRLSTEGVTPRSGAKWHPTQVQRVLQRAEAK